MPIHTFGNFRYDAEQHVLFRGDVPVPLAPKAIDTLQVLLERRGRIVEKGELMKLVWPDTTVEEIGLARNISILRKALEESSEGSFIETVPRRGYRFVGDTPEIPLAPERSRLPRWATLAIASAAMAGLIYWQFYVPSRFVARGAGLVSLAVVPFESAEFTDLLVTDLSKVPTLQVVSPSTVRRHQRFGVSMGLMGRLLGLDLLVEGSVRSSAQRLMITARLVDVHTGKVVWAENYDRPSADGQDAYREAAQDVSTHIAGLLARYRT